jgi:N utilization substance protein A
MVVNEVRGEKVDIVPYTDDPAEFVMKALAPARVREVRIHPDTGIAEVIVPDFQLSLAIGKEGQNARLAARLSGWRVDIKSESQLAEEESGGGVEYAEGEWVENPSGELVWQPAEGGETISAAEAGYASPDLGAAVGDKAEDGAVKPPMDPTSLGDKPTPPIVPAPPSQAAAPEAASPAEGVEEPTAPSTQTDAVSAPSTTEATKTEEKEGTVS